MAEHLTKEEIDLLSKREFRGKGLFDALKHIEICEECRLQIKLPVAEEILNRFDLEPQDLNLKPAAHTNPDKK